MRLETNAAQPRPRRTHDRRMGPMAEFILDGRPSGWAARHFSSDERRPAPGAPGDDPTWAPAAKVGVGTALRHMSGGSSLVWFTLAQGVLSEVFYPRVDRACTRELTLVVTDGRNLFSDERKDAGHRVEQPSDAVPLYRLINSCRRDRYRIEKTFFAHPFQDAVVQLTRFVPLQGKLEDYRLFAVLDPHVDNHGGGNDAWLGVHRAIPMLFAARRHMTLALACSAPWVGGTVGFRGSCDPLIDLARNKWLTQEYDRASCGNVVLAGEIDLRACEGNFVLVIGLGPGHEQAGHRALASLMDDPERIRSAYAHGWSNWQESLAPLDRPPGGRSGTEGSRTGRDLGRISKAVLLTHGDSSMPGAFIASLSTPWGQVRGDENDDRGTGGYHLVWPRDLVETAGGLLAAGASAEAARVLSYLRATQLPDGHWPQNYWVSGTVYWSGIQLGETALPILLLDLLRREGGLNDDELAWYWPMVRRAAAYIVSSGPSTQEDRWENQRGYTPYTLGALIAALLIAAEMADRHGEPAAGAYLRETADAWNTAIESWLYVRETALARRLGIDGYYVRSIPPEDDLGAPPRLGHVKLRGPAEGKKGLAATEIVSPDGLALVRFGLRRADDPRIVSTLKAIDALLKVDTPRGPAWRRYNGDGYGETPEGTPMMLDRDRGIGRAWPLLTGERAHYELAAGRPDEAVRLLHAMETLAGDSGLLPEQVWDTDDIPDRGLFLGRPTGSAMPLAWAHAEYLKLRRSLQDGRPFDTPPQTVARYRNDRAASDRACWRFDHPRTEIMAGDVLRVELKAPALVRWSDDGWNTIRETATRDSGLGIHFADLDTSAARPRGAVQMTFFWTEEGRWEGVDHRVKLD